MLVIGTLAYFLLGRMTAMRRVDRATVAGYYGSDSAGTFAPCVAVLASVNIAFDAYMPLMLAVMEIPGCLVALYLVAFLRHRGIDAAGFMPEEPGYTPPATVGVGPGAAHRCRVASRSASVSPFGEHAVRARAGRWPWSTSPSGTDRLSTGSERPY